MSNQEMIESIASEVMKRLAQGEQGASDSPASETPVSDRTSGEEIVLLPSELARYIDHTLLKPEATSDQMDRLCDEAREHRFYSVCVNTTWVEYCAKRLQGSDVKVCAVVGFPLGAMAGRAKNFETRHAIEAGAREIDMVINVGALKSRDLKTVEEDIRWVKRACGRNAILKVIIETALLTDEEKVLVCRIAKNVGVDFVKTSTGFSHHGATIRDVRLMKQTVGEKIQVKAAGGVRTFDDAIQMIKAGATRLGTSSGVKLVQGEESDGGY